MDSRIATYAPHIASALVVAISACATWYWVRSRYARYRRSSIAKRALGAERVAVDVLRRLGYAVVQTQVRQTWPVRHGEQQIDVQLRADILVERERRRYIAEVKSSSAVADLRHGPTRRQLLEYAIAYDTDGVLLVDPHTAQVEEVGFPRLNRAPSSRPTTHLVALLVAFLCGFCFGGGSWAAWADAPSEVLGPETGGAL